MRQNIKELFRYYNYLLKVEHLFSIDFGANLEWHKFGNKNAKDTFVYRLDKKGFDEFVSGVNGFIDSKKKNEDFAYSFAILGGKARDIENENNKKEKYFPILVAQLADVGDLDIGLEDKNQKESQKKKIKHALSNLEFLVGNGGTCPMEMPFIFLSPKIIQHIDDEQITQNTDNDALSAPQLQDGEISGIERGDITFKDILSSRLENFLQKSGLDAAWGQDWYICMYKSSFTAGLRKIYKYLLKEEKDKKSRDIGLLDEYFSFKYPKTQKSLFGIKQELEYSKRHLGSLDAKYPLMPSQRIAVYTFLDEKLNIAPINGGPGTGKTSVLRAMFADFVVKTAMDSANRFLKNGQIPNTAPFVCTSTNNQALININEGVAIQFADNALHNNGDLLYERWISDKDPKEKQEILDNKSFLVPNLKTKIDEKKGVDKSNKSINDIVNAANRVKDNETYYIEKCETFLGIKYETHIPIEFYKIVFKKLLDKIRANKERICADFDKVTADELEQIESFEQEFLKLVDNNQKHALNLRTFLRKFRENPLKLSHLNGWETKREDIKASIGDCKKTIADEANDLERHKGELTKILKKLKAYQNKLPETLFQKLLINFCYCFIQKRCIPKLEKKKAFREEIINKIEQEQKALQKKIDTLKHIDRKLVKCIEFCEKNWFSNLPSGARSVIESIKDKKGANIFDKGNGFAKAYKNAADELETRAKLDTKERVENFYYSLHILEGLFFAKDKLSANRECEQAFYCPCCINSAMDRKQGRNSGEDYLVCPLRGHKLAFKKLKEDSKKEQLIHNEDLLRKLLLDSVVECPEGGYFALEVKEDFINVEYKNKKEDADIYSSNLLLTQIFPIFPIISVTCNSFGSIIKPQRGFLNYLLVDEAGTIPPSKAVVLYSAKKAIFFGDTKQLKPVFNITHTMEQDLLRAFIKDENAREKANRYFSCGDYLGDRQYKAKEADKEVRNGVNYDNERFANNVMDVANNAAAHIILPYNPSKLRGDIWLKEHFRCGKPIADIANKMTYNGEMIIKTPHNGSVIWVENIGEKRGTSNEEEIKQIRDYLLRELNELRKRVGASPELDDADFCKKHIGIITPFAEQGRKIKDEFESNKQLSHIKIGTVHTFQGSERDIIVFSTVYGKNASNPKNFFFNRGETDLLNVAVTRAKKVLIVFGNKNLLGQDDCHSKYLCDAVK